MKTLQYKKNQPNRVRSLSPEALSSLGIELQSELVWDSTNHHRVQVSDRNAEILLAKMPTEFELVEDDEELEDETEDTSPDSDETDEDGEPDEDDSEEDSEDD